MVNDMTQGGLTKSLLIFSAPLILSGLLQQLFNWADALIVGNVEGDLALAAIGAAGIVPSVLVFIVTGFTSGIGILAAQMYGSGEHQGLRKVLSSFAVSIGGVFLVVGLAGALFTGEILRVMNTSSDMFLIAQQYLRICLLGTPFVAVYNVYASVLRGCGDSKIAFLTICVSSLTNVILDILFVAVFRWGAAGAAGATVFSQGAMTVFIVYYTGKKYEQLRFKLGRGAMDRSALGRGTELGLPITVQSSVKSVGNLMLQSFMNGFHSQTVAAITTAYRIDSVIMLPILNFGTGIATAVAQNMGKGNLQRAKKAMYVGTAAMVVVSLVLTGFVILFGEGLLSIFGLSEQSVAIGTEFFWYIARFYLMFGVSTALRNYLEGSGDVIFTSILSIFAMAVRIGLSYYIGKGMGNDIFAFAEGVSWTILLVGCLLRCVWLIQKKKKEYPMLEQSAK